MTRTLAAKILSPILASLAFASAHAHAATGPTITPTPTTTAPQQLDWNRLQAEGLSYFQSYLRFDTSNPPDDTSAAIAFLKQILDKEGIETQVYVSKPGMANLVARLSGPSGVKPLLLMS